MTSPTISGSLRAGLATLLDQYDETRRVAQERKEQAFTDRALFVSQFAELRRDVLRPVFEAAGAILKARGHDFSIQEEEFAAQAAGRTAEAGIVFRIAPAGMEKGVPADDDFRALSFTTRHYNKTVWIRNGAMPHEGATARDGYALARITAQLAEEEVLKLVSALVKG
jgi:RNase adaptor protein for sRNA GlmZ degradation